MVLGEKEDSPLKGVVRIDEMVVIAKGKRVRPGRDPNQESIVVMTIE
ncbi:MAG: hypothetical protein ACI97A_002015 [Planctomycetota bacterium]|jgi:hypothetical protein